MTSLLLAVLALLFGLDQDPLAQESAPASTCLTCSGAGVAEATCETCEGAGKAACRYCLPMGTREQLAFQYLLLREVPLTGEPIEDDLTRLKEALAEHSARLDEIFQGPRPTPGWIRCPIRQYLPLFHKELCKVCKGKAEIKCTSCKGRARTKCTPCKGRKQHEGTCHECAGSGTGNALEDRLGVSAEAMELCPWCGGEEALPCEACPPDGQVTRTCPPCSGQGKAPCGVCYGTGQAACKECFGVGETKIISVRGSRIEKCGYCKGKGQSKCNSCKRGTDTCTLCLGSGSARLSCTSCTGSKRAYCRGCRYGAGTAWWITGERLLEVGQPADGFAHLEHAIAREQEMVQRVLELFEGSIEERRAFEKKLDARIAGQQKKLAKLRK